MDQFLYEGSPIRVIVKDGTPWWMVKDVCDVLGHSDASTAVRRLDDDEKLTQTMFVSGQNREVWLVNEPGLYSLILRSRKPDAKRFKRWITHEVLPSIRQTGTYAVATPKTNAEFLLEVAKQLVEQETRIQHIEERTETAHHRIDSLDAVNVVGDLQQRLTAMVKKYAHQNGYTFSKGWRDFTKAYDTAYRTRLTALIENYKTKHGLRELTRPQYLSMTGHLEDGIRVADKMLNQVAPMAG